MESHHLRIGPSTGLPLFDPSIASPDSEIIPKPIPSTLLDDVDYAYLAGHLTAEDSETNAEYQAFEGYMKETHFHLCLDPAPFPPEVQFSCCVVTTAQERIG